jgi:hypothetical protein
VRVNVELEPGTRVAVTDSVMNQLFAIAREEIPEARNIMVESGGGGFRSNGSHMGELRIQLKPQAERDRSAKDIAMAIRPHMNIHPGMVVRTRVSGMMMRGRGGGNTDDRLAVEIRGHDLEILSELAEKVRTAMASIEGVPEVQVSRQPGMPEMVLQVDRIKAATMGLNVSDVAEAMETAVGGRRTSMYRQQGDEFNIIVRLKELDRMDLSQVGKVPLVTVGGTPVPAESILSMRRQEGPTSVDRVDQERVVTVSGTLGARDLGSVMKDLRAKLVDIPRPSGYEFTYGGEYEEQQKSFRELTFAAILALILVYMVMAAQFESLRDPFIILFSIPLAAVGVVTMLIATQTTFNMQAFLGVIMLVGIVVNNAILLVDYTNRLRRDEGFGLTEAVITAGKRRLRPVLMTTVTTVLGLAPMALGLGEGSELQQPMARVVIGGLLSSMLITLVVIPTIYFLVESKTEAGEEREATDVPAARQRRLIQSHPLPAFRPLNLPEGVGGRILLLNQGELPPEHVLDQARQALNGQRLEARFTRRIEVTHSAEHIGNKGKFLKVVLHEFLALGLPTLPKPDGLAAAGPRALGMAGVVAQPGRVQRGPAGVGTFTDTLQQQGVGGEPAGILWQRWVSQPAAVLLAPHNRERPGIGRAQVTGSVTAMRALHHPIRQGGPHHFTWPRVEIGRLNLGPAP